MNIEKSKQESTEQALTIPVVSGSYFLPRDTNGTQIKKGDKLEFTDIVWNGYGSCSYPRRTGVVTETEIDGEIVPCIDYSIGDYERLAFFIDYFDQKYLVV
jgi:hypothetical protein